MHACRLFEFRESKGVAQRRALADLMGVVLKVRLSMIALRSYLADDATPLFRSGMGRQHTAAAEQTSRRLPQGCHQRRRLKRPHDVTVRLHMPCLHHLSSPSPDATPPFVPFSACTGSRSGCSMPSLRSRRSVFLPNSTQRSRSTCMQKKARVPSQTRHRPRTCHRPRRPRGAERPHSPPLRHVPHLRCAATPTCCVTR